MNRQGTPLVHLLLAVCVSAVKDCFGLLKQLQKPDSERIVADVCSEQIRRAVYLQCAFVSMALVSAAYCQEKASIPLPTSKILAELSPGRIGFVNSFPATIAISPDGRYAALLNDGYGTVKSRGHQSIAVLNLSTSEL